MTKIVIRKLIDDEGIGCCSSDQCDYEDCKNRTVEFIHSLFSSSLQEIEKLRKRAHEPQFGIVRAQRMRMKTLKEGDVGMAYDDGFNAAIDDVLALLKGKK